MLTHAIIWWFEDWLRADDWIEEPPPLGAWLVLLAAFACLLRATRNELGLLGSAVFLGPLPAAALIVSFVTMGFYVHRRGWRLVLLTVLDLAGSICAATLVGARLLRANGGALRDEVSSWLAAFIVLSLLLGAHLHLRAWALLGWYASVAAFTRERAAELRAVLHGAPTGRDFIFTVQSLSEPDAQGELRDASGSCPAAVAVEHLAAKFAERSVLPVHFLLRGVEAHDEHDPSAGYRSGQVRQRIDAVASSQSLGNRLVTEGSWFLHELAFSAAMLLLQHGLLALAAHALVVWA